MKASGKTEDDFDIFDDCDEPKTSKQVKGLKQKILARSKKQGINYMNPDSMTQLLSQNEKKSFVLKNLESKLE